MIYYKTFNIIDDNGIKNLKKIIRFYINEIYIQLIRNTNSDIVKINYCMFLNNIQNQKSHALVEAQKVNKKKLTIIDRYLIYRIK